MTTSIIKLYHNPDCSKSRTAVALLEEHHAEFQIVHYMKTPPTPQDIKKILAALNKTAHDIIREKEARESEIDLSSTDEEELIQTLSKHPHLLQRPIAIINDKAEIGRPPENILKLL